MRDWVLNDCLNSSKMFDWTNIYVMYVAFLLPGIDRYLFLVLEIDDVDYYGNLSRITDQMIYLSFSYSMCNCDWLLLLNKMFRFWYFPNKWASEKQISHGHFLVSNYLLLSKKKISLSHGLNQIDGFSRRCLEGLSPSLTRMMRLIFLVLLECIQWSSTGD